MSVSARGDSGDMARFEALALLTALSTWSRVIFSATGSSIAVGDALGMLHGATRFKSHDPVTNAVFMEMALIVAPHGATVEAVHIWSEENVLADALSRSSVPQRLAKVARTHIVEKEWRILGRPSPPRLKRGMAEF